MRYHVTLFLLIFVAAVYSQGLISNYSDVNGSYLKLGPKATQFSIPVNLNMGGNSIFTSGGPITALRRPTLKLNPVNGNVTIGSTESDFAGLTIRAASEAQNNVDLRLEGQGNIGIQSSMFIQLDDDDDENAFFLIRDSEMNNLFTVSEAGQSYLKGDLTIDGKIVGAEEVLVLSGNVFHARNESEDIIQIGTDLWTGAEEEEARFYSNLPLPHGARINKIEIIYKDNGSTDIELFLRATPNLRDVGRKGNNVFSWDSSNSSESTRMDVIDNLNITIDHISNVYYVELYSDDWGANANAFRAVRFYYTR